MRHDTNQIFVNVFIKPKILSVSPQYSHMAMYSKQFLPLLILRFKFSRLIRSVPFEYDATSGKLIVMQSRRGIRVTQIQSLVTLTYFLVLLYNYLFGNVPLLKTLQGFPFLIVYATLIACGWNVGLDIDPVQIINSILKFERRLVQG